MSSNVTSISNLQNAYWSRSLSGASGDEGFLSHLPNRYCVNMFAFGGLSSNLTAKVGFSEGIGIFWNHTHGGANDGYGMLRFAPVGTGANLTTNVSFSYFKTYN